MRRNAVMLALLALGLAGSVAAGRELDLPPGSRVHFDGDSIFKGWGFGKYDHPSPLCRIQDICTLLARDNLATPLRINRIEARPGEGGKPLAEGPGGLVSARIQEKEIGPEDWIYYEDAGPHGANYHAYRRKLAGVCQAAAGAQRRVFLMTMFDYQPAYPNSAYDAPTRDVPSKSINDAIRDEAAAQGVPFLDMNRFMDSLQASLQDRGWGSTCHKDGIHPNVFGNLMMALVILRSLGADVAHWRLEGIEKHFLHPESGGDVPDMKAWGWPKDPSDEERRDLVRTVQRLAVALPPQSGGAAASDDRKVFLFVDWFHVKKGELKVTLDPERISEDGKKRIAAVKKDFGLTFEQGAHGFRPVDTPSGIRIVQEVATRSKPWLLADQPWEKDVGTATVLHDEGRYRCWYLAGLREGKTEVTVDQGRVMELSGSALAYAESVDGWNWTKPALGILSHRGDRANNLVSPYANGGAVFRDDHGPPGERYKCFHFDELPPGDVPKAAPSAKRYGLYGVTSPDGTHWKKLDQPLVRYFCDTVNVAAWDPLLGKYVGYFRHHLSGRTISRAETDDFGNWPDPRPFLYAGPLDAPADDYYTNGYTTYPSLPSLRLLFPAIYHRDSDSVDVRLAVSRDGRAFQWVSYEPIITLGRAGEWDGGSLYANPNLVQLPDGRLALPFDAHNTTHNEAFFESYYRDYPSTTGAAWALWGDGRLAGIQADRSGQFTTNSAPFNGKRIQINARTTRGGAVEVELRERGKAVDGFSFADCVPFNGDEIWATCRWRDKDDLAALRGRNLELAIRLRSAKIFAYRFR